jgi:hypothetical protein
MKVENPQKVTQTIVIRVNAVKNGESKLVGVLSKPIKALLEVKSVQQLQFDKCIDKEAWIAVTAKLQRAKPISSNIDDYSFINSQAKGQNYSMIDVPFQDL